MQKKQCPNGHYYDTSIYGDKCPLCPPESSNAGSSSFSGPETHLGGNSMYQSDLHTHIAGGGAAAQNGATSVAFKPQAAAATNDKSGPTKMRPQDSEPRGGGHTVIRHVATPGVSGQQDNARRLVGFLVTYNRNASGRAYNIYEGRNYVGRDASCDISVPEDSQMSGRHMSILYRNVDNKFKFRDEQSSNGTFINKELLDDGELNNYDIIRIGSTIFIFIAIPKIF